MIVFFRQLRILFCWGLLSLCVVQGERAFALDLNQASRSQLLAVKGIGIKTADRILAARKQRPFSSLEDFVARVPGFGPKRRQALREQNVTVGMPPIQTETGNSSIAATDVFPETVSDSLPKRGPDARLNVVADRIQSRPSAVSGKVMPAMPMLIRPRPRQSAPEHDSSARADRSTSQSTWNRTAGAGIRDKSH